MKFNIVLAMTFASGFVVMTFVRALSWPYWSYHVVTIVIGIVGYVVSAMLTGYFIEKNSPEFANDEETIPGIKNWELTAGFGIVPKWVSFIGLAGLGFILASPFELLASLFR